MAAKIKTPCKGRKRATCKRARKSCSYVSGSKRSYCRKSRSTRKVRK